MCSLAVRCRDAYFPLKSKTHSKFFWSRYLLSPVKIWVCNSTSDIFKTTILLLQHNWKVQITSKIQQNKILKCRSAAFGKVTYIAKKLRHLNSRKSYILTIDFSKISRSTFSQSNTSGFQLLPKNLDIKTAENIIY